MYFTSLVQWLLEKAGSKASGWNQYDDPGTVINNIMIDLKNVGIVLNYPATKLKSGSGEAVCQALLELSQVALNNSRFKFRKPIIPDDDAEEDGAEEDDMEGNADLADNVQDNFSDDEDIAEFVEEEIPRDQKEEEDREMIEAGIDPDEWERECQRVAHKLKPQKKVDVKEWRSHLDQTKKYAETVKANLPDVRQKLEKVSNEVTRDLEKIQRKEALLNKGMTGMTGNYRNTASSLKEVTERYNTVKQHVEDMEQQYYDIDEELNKITSAMDEAGKNISDQSPLLKIKKGIEKVKKDIKSIDIRIGVVSNTLLQCKLKQRNSDSDAQGEDKIFGEDDLDDDM